MFLILVACGGEDDLGLPCSLSDPCPYNVCDFTDPGGPICIDRDGDLDGDGIGNVDDHCQHLAGGQFDEDGDGFGNECDACPIAAPRDSLDPDGDGVESPCDPDPTTPGDQIAVFDGFDNGLPAGWQATPNWEFVGGEVIALATAAAGAELTAPLPLVSQNIAVLGQYRIDAIDSAASSSFAGVIAIDERPAGGSEVQCAGTRTGDTDRLVLNTDAAAGSANFANLFDTASLYRVAMTLEGAQAACAMVADDETGATQAGSTGQLMNRAGLVALGATARFQYLLVIQRQVDNN